ncbi:hypothetical protein AAVH_12071 [Aphelenchoides avenae]|nr:hypothetical protein AAVH_12071 [Aphelenchus avenae]
MDGSGSSGRDAEYQRAVKEEIIDDGELDELSRSPADASDDIDPQQLHAAMEDVALDTDRTYRLQLEARIAQLESRVEELITERDQVGNRLGSTGDMHQAPRSVSSNASVASGPSVRKMPVNQAV